MSMKRSEVPGGRWRRCGCRGDHVLHSQRRQRHATVRHCEMSTLSCWSAVTCIRVEILRPFRRAVAHGSTVSVRATGVAQKPQAISPAPRCWRPWSSPSPTTPALHGAADAAPRRHVRRTETRRRRRRRCRARRRHRPSRAGASERCHGRHGAAHVHGRDHDPRSCAARRLCHPPLHGRSCDLSADRSDSAKLRGAGDRSWSALKGVLDHL